MKFDINFFTIIAFAILGAVTSLLTNKGIAVFHDGLRPLFPQYFQKRLMTRLQLLGISFAMCIGLVVGFGVPTSIAGGIIVVHTILLGTDVIGLLFDNDKKGNILVCLIGATYALLLMFGMKYIVIMFGKMPVDFLSSLSEIAGPVTIAFVFFPCLAIAYQHGFKKGFITFLFTVFFYQLFKGVFSTLVFGKLNIPLSADGIALIFSMVVMIILGIKDKRNNNAKTNSDIQESFAFFEDNVVAIRKNYKWLMLSGGLSAACCTLLIMAEGPASLQFMSESNYTSAALVASGRALGFIPLVMTTAIVAGVYSPEGTKLLFIPAVLLIPFGIPGVVASFVLGALIMFIEVYVLKYVAQFLDKFPGVKDMGDHVRTAMTKVLELALLLGALLASGKMAPNFGYLFVMGCYLLNKTSKKPITEMAVGPLSAIALGLIVNVLYIVGLFQLPVK